MPPVLRIAFLHLAPIPGDLAGNRRLVQRAVLTAARHKADWILTPELCVTGYDFASAIGTDWILPQPDPWMTEFCRFTAGLRVTVFLSHPERDPQSGLLHNSLFVIGPDGSLLGRHRKIHVLRVGAESWSRRGDRVTPVVLSSPRMAVGLLICADAFDPAIAQRLKARGAHLLLSAAAWAPGLHGPEGEWERCSHVTGLPLFVCNRTGMDRKLNFTGAESVIAREGRRRLSFAPDRSAMMIVQWDLEAQDFASPEHVQIEL